MGSGDWLADAAQHEASGLLQQVHDSLGQVHSSIGGTYLHGPVGSGKTALMDLLVDSCEAGQVRRFHFHELMCHVHGQMHRGKIVPEIGVALGSETPLLAVDEMQLTDIADAAILARLTAALCTAGAKLVITSNRAPEELYEGGLNRHVHVPAFCASLRAHGMQVHRLASERGDYRELAAGPTAAAARFHCPPSRAANVEMRRVVGELGGQPAAEDGAAADAADADGATDASGAWLPLGGGRGLRLEHAAGGACLVSWQALCVEPLGAADYLRLSRAYHTVAVAGVPQLTPELHNEARRFIAFLDVWYDRGGGLLLSAAVPSAQIFAPLQPEAMRAAAEWSGAAAAVVGDVTTATVRSEGGSSSGWATTYLAGDTEWSATGRLGVSLAGLAGLNDAAFAQQRATSRLKEMLGASWAAASRTTLEPST